MSKITIINLGVPLPKSFKGDIDVYEVGIDPRGGNQIQFYVKDINASYYNIGHLKKNSLLNQIPNSDNYLVKFKKFVYSDYGVDFFISFDNKKPMENTNIDFVDLNSSDLQFYSLRNGSMLGDKETFAIELDLKDKTTGAITNHTLVTTIHRKGRVYFRPDENVNDLPAEFIVVDTKVEMKLPTSLK